MFICVVFLADTGISVPTDTHIKIEKKHTDTVVTDKPTIRDDVVDTPSAPVKSEKKTAADFVDENWTLEQVEALYKGTYDTGTVSSLTRCTTALASISADSDNRWDKIAAAVPGKDKKDCQSKVKVADQNKCVSNKILKNNVSLHRKSSRPARSRILHFS